jgi:hypothetical protein
MRSPRSDLAMSNHPLVCVSHKTNQRDQRAPHSGVGIVSMGCTGSHGRYFQFTRRRCYRGEFEYGRAAGDSVGAVAQIEEYLAGILLGARERRTQGDKEHTIRVKPGQEGFPQFFQTIARFSGCHWKPP